MQFLEGGAQRLLVDARPALNLGGGEATPGAAPPQASKGHVPHLVAFLVVFLTALICLGGAAALLDGWLPLPRSFTTFVVMTCVALFLAFAGVVAGVLTPFAFLFWVCKFGERMTARFGVFDF